MRGKTLPLVAPVLRYGYWVVSGVAADILRMFDLGRGGLYPVRVLKNDRRCLNFGNQKTVLVTEQSKNIHQRARRRYKQGIERF